MNDVIFADLSYKVTGLCFQVQNKLGRFCREVQYSDEFELFLQQANMNYKREFEIKLIKKESPKGNKVDFLIDDKIILDAKAKPYITKDDYYQMQRYLQSANLKLGLIVNFRNTFLKPKRVLNSRYSHEDSQHSHRSSGYVALISIIVVGAIGATIGVSLLLLGLNASRTSFAQEQSGQARALANACAEEALQNIRTTTSYTGTSGLTLGQGTCSFTVTNTGGENRTVTASGTVGTIIRRVQVLVTQINPQILYSWQEVAN